MRFHMFLLLVLFNSICFGEELTRPSRSDTLKILLVDEVLSIISRDKDRDALIMKLKNSPYPYSTRDKIIFFDLHAFDIRREFSDNEKISAILSEIEKQGKKSLNQNDKEGK